jgi:hypothetical protein
MTDFNSVARFAMIVVGTYGIRSAALDEDRREERNSGGLDKAQCSVRVEKSSVTAINRARNSTSTAVCAIQNSHHLHFIYRTRKFRPSRQTPQSTQPTSRNYQKEKDKNNQQQVFAGGHPPNY